MTRVIVPDGQTVTVAPVGRDPLTGNRSSRYRFDVLDSSGRKFGELDGVSSGTVTWNANSQVKGGGKINVAKDHNLKDRDIRVTKNLPLIGNSDFETDTEGYAFNAEFGTNYEAPTSVTRDTNTVYEGTGSLDIEWAAASTDPNIDAQNVVGDLGSVVEGERYTAVARVYNPTATEAYAKISFIKEVPIPAKDEWQTVYVQFTAIQDGSIFFGAINYDGVAGDHTYIDDAVLYEGWTTGYNGEVYDYAPFSWLHARIRPVLEIENVQEEPLGVFIPAAPIEQHDDSGARQEIELLDRTSVLAQDYVPTSYTVKAGTNVISAVRTLIASTGEPVGAITTSTETVNGDLTWGPGTNKLTIVNELLSAAGFFGLFADGNGQFQVQEYRPPKSRSVSYTMLDDNESVFIPTLSIDRDVYDIPNRVVMTAQGDGESEGWTATATDENEESPFSFQSRGRWVTDVQLGIEATSQANLQTKAERRLRALAATQASVDIQHAPLPNFHVNDVIRFRRKTADVDTLFTVTKTQINFDPTALAKTTITQVIDL